MTSSSFDWDLPLRDRTATPYLRDGSPWRVLPPQDAAADGLFTTGGDMARFIAAPIPGLLLPVGAGVLNSQTVTHLFEPAFPVAGNPIAFVGHAVPTQGFFLEKSPRGPIVVSNGGYDPGWSAQFFVVPATGDGLVILTNSSRGLPFIAQIAGLWADWRGLPKPQITDIYRSLGMQAILIVGILTVASIPAGVALLLGIQSGRRRFAAFNRAALLLSAVEILLSIGLVGLYVLIRAGFEALPTFALVAEAAITFMTFIVIARLVFPEARDAGPSDITKAA
jgi:CubicO group peptidase (beta-lactamase class C family)